MANLGFYLKQTALEGITNDRVVREYKDNVDKFTAWAKGAGYKYRTLNAVPDRQALIQEYTNHLITQGRYSPSTIHTYLAPICKGMGVSMRDITKPKRTADSVTKSRSGTNRSRAALVDPRNAEVVQIARAVGVRKSELIKLTGADLVSTENGVPAIRVRRGKGGKEQLQVILPADRELITRICAAAESQRLVSPEVARHIKRDLDVHALRREHAQTAYEHYIKQDPARLRADLLRTFDERYNSRGKYNSKQMADARQRFLREMDGVYKLRGDNRRRAMEAGRPTSYSKLALLAVSVWHLAHWRNDVTVKHYMV